MEYGGLRNGPERLKKGVRRRDEGTKEEIGRRGGEIT